MKLLSHNILRNNSSSVKSGYPLQIIPTEVRVTDNKYNELFTKHILQTINWGVFVKVSYRESNSNLWYRWSGGGEWRKGNMNPNEVYRYKYVHIRIYIRIIDACDYCNIGITVQPFLGMTRTMRLEWGTQQQQWRDSLLSTTPTPTHTLILTPPQAASSLGLTTLPPSLTPSLESDPSFLRAVHHVLVNVHVVEGVLTCPETGREFTIKDGIVDVMMEEEECINVKI